MARRELELAERAAMEQLDLLKATDEEKLQAAQSFTDKRTAIADEETKYLNDLKKIQVENDLSLASQAIGALGGLLAEGSNAAKAAAIAQTTIDTYLGAQKAFTSQLIPGDPTSIIRAQIAAGVAIVGGIANVRKIIATPTPQGGGGGGGTLPSAPSVPSFNPTASGAVEGGNNITGPSGSGNAVRAYVVSSDMTSQQQADKKINDLATL